MNKKNNKLIIFIFIPVVFVIGLLLGLIITNERTVTIENVQGISSNSIQKQIPIVGVTEDGKGIVASMLVEVKPGTGLVLVNVNNVLADYVSQLSARKAAKVAANVTKKDLSNLDIIYSIKANAKVIAGPSAGAAMTLATIAALENKTIIDSVFITGGIEEDGTISVVGNVREKSQAAKESNATVFLVPEAVYNVGYKTVKECEQRENINYCEISYLPNNSDLSELLGIKVIPVRTIQEAVKEALK